MRARSVAGVVRGPDGRGIAGARITVVDTSASTRKITGVSRDDGSWEIEGLGNEPVEVKAEADGFAEVTLKDVLPDSKDVVLELVPLGSVKGTVVDGDGRPVKAFSAKPEVVEIESGYPRPRSLRYKTYGNPEGTFEIKNLSPGRYTIVIQAPGYRGTRVRDVRVAAGEATDVGEVTLLPGGILTGRVVDPDGRPIAGAKVSVIGGGNHFVMSRGRRPATSVVTGPNGEFKFEGLKGGKMRVKASFEGFVTTQSDSFDPNELDGDLVLTLERGSSIMGTVVDGRDRPVPKISVYLTGESVNDRTVTDEQGRFEFTGLPGGRYTVRTFTFKSANRKPPKEAIEKVDLPAGETLELILRRG